MTNEVLKSMFINTRQHQRFVEFCDSCRSNRYIGVCTGKSGVGKTRSSQAYAQWDLVEPFLNEPLHRGQVPPDLNSCHTVIYTPGASCTLKRVESAIAILRNRFDVLMEKSLCWHNPGIGFTTQRRRFLELLIIDKAHRLSLKCLDAISDMTEKYKLGIVLLGPPGFGRRIRNHEQFNNQVGFYHIYSVPRTEELRAILEARWQSEQITIQDSAVEMLEKVTSSNIQKLVNINAEMSRVCELNSITLITPDLVQLASKTLLLDTI